MRRVLAKTFLAYLCWLVFPVCLFAQDMPDVAQGITPYVAFHGGTIDQVNTMSGGLTVRIPLLSYPQLGSLALSYSVVFNSFSFQDFQTCDAAKPDDPNDPIHTAPPARNNCRNAIQLGTTGIPQSLPLSPRLILDQKLLAGGTSVYEEQPDYHPAVDGRFYVIGADNSEHILEPTNSGYRSVDQSGYLFTPTLPPAVGNGNLGSLASSTTAFPGQNVMTPATGTIVDPHGTRYTTSSIVDTDGNTITIGTSSSGGLASGVPLTDSTGRSFPDLTEAGSTAGCPTISDAQFQPLVDAQQWVVPGDSIGGTVSYLFCYVTVNIRSHFVIPGATSGSTQYVRQVQMLQSIKLPNGSFWGFIYDSNDPNSSPTPTAANQSSGLGQLITLIYPTQGRVTYTYHAVPGLCDAQRISGINPSGIEGTYIPQVASRTMWDLGGTQLGTWNYTYPQTLGDSSSILSPSSELTVNHFVTDGTHCGLLDAGQDFYSGATTSTALLRQTRTTYASTLIGGLPEAATNRAMQTTTTLEDGSVSSVSRSYAQGITFSQIQCDYTGQNCASVPGQLPLPVGGPVSTTYTGYDGSVLRIENTAYVWQSNTNYFNANLLDIPASNQITDGAGVQVSLTAYTYDQPYYAPPGGVRGHVTTITPWLNTNSSASPVMHAGWETTGEKKYVIDAVGTTDPTKLNSAGHTTDYVHGDCGGSVITSTTNALNQTVSGTYNCSTGTLASYTDLNGNVSHFTYDTSSRLHTASYPDQGLTTITISDAANKLEDTVQTSATTSKTLATYFDGFGRKSKTLTPDPQPNSPAAVATVLYSYDAVGHLHNVTNPAGPAYPGNTTTSGSTTYTYDALGRLVSTLLPDGGTTSATFNGAQVVSVDAASKVTKHVSDALGRLTDVYEDPNGLNYHTLYQYDTLGNLKNVNQMGDGSVTALGRSFTYDSLSRLITSQNPETGTICYGQWGSSPGGGSPACGGGYDPNGNLLYKTDATGSYVGYTYDALNRLQSRVGQSAYAYPSTVTDGDNVSFNETFVYDGGTNGIGRLWYSNRDGLNWKLLGYDAMGRVTQEDHATYPYWYFWQAGFGATYDLAGDLTQLAYPDGRVTTQAFDSAGRLGAVWSAPANGGATLYASGPAGGTTCATGSLSAPCMSYSPAGALTAVQYGNGVTVGFAQNSRLQPLQSWADTPALSAAATGHHNLWDRSLAYTSPNLNCPSTANNGNIANIFEAVSGVTQNFCYDGLNRLSTAVATDGSYRQDYHYDPFGNMTPWDYNNTALNSAYSIDAGTNRLLQNGTDLVYDSAGRLARTPYHSFLYYADGDVRCVDGCATASYLSNAAGERTMKQVVGGAFTTHIYFAGQNLSEHELTGDTWSDYILANGQRIAKIDSHAGTLTTHFYMNDQLGTTQLETDAAGVVTARTNFTPFGREVINGTTQAILGTEPPDGASTHFKFTGKERDAESGLDYFGARYYSSSMGRFMSPDWNGEPEAIPFADLRNPQSLNLYSYVHNNPLRVADPDGHDGDDEDEESGCCDLLPSKAEVDTALAGIAAATEVGAEWTVSTLAAPVVAVGGLLLYAPDGGGGIEDRELRQMAQRRAADAAKKKNDDQEHTKDARPSTKEKHQKGRGRKKKDKGGEKGDKRRQQNGMFPRKPPGGTNPKGGWPPSNFNEFLPIPVPPPDKKKDKHGDG